MKPKRRQKGIVKCTPDPKIRQHGLYTVVGKELVRIEEVYSYGMVISKVVK